MLLYLQYYKTLSRRVAACRCFRELSVGERQYKQSVKNTYEFPKESVKQVESGV